MSVTLTTSDGRKIELPVDSTNAVAYLEFEGLKYRIGLTNKKKLVMQ